jgi:uncharacterized membrane protein YphA (DoxX/SURF4 family)
LKEPVLVVRRRSWAPYLLSVLRIVAAFLFMQVGTAKLFALPAAIMPGGGTAPLGSLYISVAGPGPWSIDARRRRVDPAGPRSTYG